MAPWRLGVEEFKVKGLNAKARRRKDARGRQSVLGSVSTQTSKFQVLGFLCVLALKNLRSKALTQRREDAKTQGEGSQAWVQSLTSPARFWFSLRLGALALRNYWVDVVENTIAKNIVECAIEVHRTLGGPGLLECVYEEAMDWELRQRNFGVDRQAIVPITYKGNLLAAPLRLDLLVDKRVIVEVKATAAYNPVFEAQALTYLRMLDLRLALVINFGEKFVKDGIHRVVNGL